ncbi:MAG: bifunctional [glutamine synthetase] adenylyltransferase/[glutamine synthetase]-adenylyl-L-tyrosine phosphorylase [Leucobacter sp.]
MPRDVRADGGTRLADFARAGFQDLAEARDQVAELARASGVGIRECLDAFSVAADPDGALTVIRRLGEAHPEHFAQFDSTTWPRAARLFGASVGLGDFFIREPRRLLEILREGGRVIERAEAFSELTAAVCPDEDRPLTGEAGWVALRVRYRELLAELMLYELERSPEGGALDLFETIAASLSVLAEAAIEASLRVATRTLQHGGAGPAVDADRLSAVRLGIVAMGKCGAEELNVVSDVDIVFVTETADDSVLSHDALMRVATRLASEMMRGIHDPASEPPLWQLDANLRPEGRQGALVRTLGSMLSYYERWAKTWEFQALLKARPIAGDLELGAQFVERTRDLVWSSSSREDFVGSVQRMRQRVTEHIDDEDLEVQLKLGPGGLRDIEFSVQLLQLVHGQYDDGLHLRGTLPALRALVARGYVARSDGERLAEDYRVLRVLEHRLQLRMLRRTARMPREPEELRVLARASGLAESAAALQHLWEAVKREVRRLHLKIFYAPLLSAVAALPEEELVLGTEEARARLASIGFRDPDGAMRHLGALTKGTSRRARIQRNLMPVLLQWFSDGTDPDFGLLAFRRVSEANLDTPWYLRLLRDGTEAAERLTRVLSNSRFAAELLETIPEAVGWLERDELLTPVPFGPLREEMRAVAARREGLQEAAQALRTVHRREILRLAMGRITGVIGEAEVAVGLDAAHTALLDGLLLAVRTDFEQQQGRAAPAIALIGMGRFGGRELGFASDIDLIAVFAAESGVPVDRMAREATRIVSELSRLVSDPRFPVDLDFDLRPEGKNGPLVRSIDAYRGYYARWSVTWEAQALIRARYVAGDPMLGREFELMADEIRYPEQFGESEVREIRRVKARVEAERLPRGEDPKRHLKLGPGGLSDVEWLVQLLQLRDGARYPTLRTVSTLEGLTGAQALGLLSAEDAEILETAWRYAGEIRSALKLWSGGTSDVLPSDWGDLAGIAGILDLPRDRVSEIDERWLTVSRRARAVFEREFFDFSPEERYPVR